MLLFSVVSFLKHLSSRWCSISGGCHWSSGDISHPTIIRNQLSMVLFLTWTSFLRCIIVFASLRRLQTASLSRSLFLEWNFKKISRRIFCCDWDDARSVCIFGRWPFYGPLSVLDDNQHELTSLHHECFMGVDFSVYCCLSVLKTLEIDSCAISGAGSLFRKFYDS